MLKVSHLVLVALQVLMCCWHEQVDCRVPLLPTSPIPVTATFPDAPVLNKLRQYLTLCCGLDYSLTPEMKKVGIIALRAYWTETVCGAYGVECRGGLCKIACK